MFRTVPDFFFCQLGFFQFQFKSVIWLMTQRAPLQCTREQDFIWQPVIELLTISIAISRTMDLYYAAYAEQFQLHMYLLSAICTHASVITSHCIFCYSCHSMSRTSFSYDNAMRTDCQTVHPFRSMSGNQLKPNIWRTIICHTYSSVGQKHILSNEFLCFF